MAIIVSDAAAESTLQAYTHPLSIQARAISELEDKVLNGDIVADGNNVFTFLTEFFSNMTAGLVNKACDCFYSLYPENAQSATDLYKHLSDFDYIGLYATPAETTVELVMDKKYVIDHAVEYENYHKLIIPDYSKFIIGDYTFGLLYPIEIRIQKAPLLEDGTINYDNCTIVVMWDTSVTSPLKTLESHVLEHREFVADGESRLAISIPIYQFKIDDYVESAIASAGFSKRYDYTDKFYAIRVFHYRNGKWNELAQTLSDFNYDVDTPTAMIKILSDINKVEVVIPQVYFNALNPNANIIGNRILVKIYTTSGKIDLNIAEYDANQFSASFELTDKLVDADNTYSTPFKYISSLYILPLSTRIASGTDGISLDELRTRVKHSASYTVKITPDDLDAYFATSGFSFTKALDNITDRVYCAHKTITDGTSSIVTSGMGISVFAGSALDIISIDNKFYIPNYSDITVLDANNVTISPTAIYKYNKAEDKFYILSDVEKANLNNMSSTQKVELLNNNLYTYSPFHVKLSLNENMPIASSYDLYTPSVGSLTFIWENTNTTAEISVYSYTVSTLIETNKIVGYRLTVSLYKSDALANVLAFDSTEGPKKGKNIQVILSTTNSRGVYIYLFGEYNGVDDTGHDVFIFDIRSEFRITDDGLIDTTSMQDMAGDVSNHFIDISSRKYQLHFFVQERFITDETPMMNVSIANLPSSVDGYVYLVQQEFTLTLGECIPLLQNNVALTAEVEEYKTYDTSIFECYNSVVYYRWTVADYKNKVIDPLTGLPVAVSKIGLIKLNRSTTDPDKIYPVIKHNVGDVIVSSPYNYTFGQTVSVKYNDRCISMTLAAPYTAQSELANKWNNIIGSIKVNKASNNGANGIYETCEADKENIDQSWKHTLYTLEEIYDKTIIPVEGSVVTFYIYRDQTGRVVKSLEKPVGIEYTTETHNFTGSYYSSNNDIVVTKAIKAAAPNNNTARAFYRKWYLLTNDSDTFEFSTYTGFSIEYVPIASDEVSGTMTYQWCLMYNYKTEDPATKLKVKECVIINNDMSSRIHSDTYISQYQDVYYLLKYISSEDKHGWMIYYTNDDQYREYSLIPLYYGYTGKIVFSLTEDTIALKDKIYYALKSTGGYTAVDIPVGTILPANTYYETNREIKYPWEVVWKAVAEGDKSSPVITRINTQKSTDTYQMDIKDAAETIIEIIDKNDLKQKHADYRDLFKYIDRGKLTTDLKFIDGKKYYTRYDNSASAFFRYEYEKAEVDIGTDIPPDTYYELVDAFIADPMCDTINKKASAFIAVETNDTNGRQQEYCNSLINYCPIDDSGNPLIDPSYPLRSLRVGAVDAEGAIYYRDVETTVYTLDDFNLTVEQLEFLLYTWEHSYRTTDAEKYEYLISEYKNKYNKDISLVTLAALISTSSPSFISPWKKLVKISSFEAFKYYINNRLIDNYPREKVLSIKQQIKNKEYLSFSTLTDVKNYLDAASGMIINKPAVVEDITEIDTNEEIRNWLLVPISREPREDWIAKSALPSPTGATAAYVTLSNVSNVPVTCIYADKTVESVLNVLTIYNTYSGFMYVLYRGNIPYAYNFTSKIDRTYKYDDSTIIRNEFNINVNDTSWLEIDKWPWELSNPWIESTTNTVLNDDSGFTITYDKDLSCIRAKHLNTDVMLDEDGLPIVATPGGRSTKFNIDMIHCDYKLSLVNDADYINYMKDIRELLHSYFNELTSIYPSLLARTKLYFSPTRTFGTSKFKGSGTDTIELTTDVSIALGLHVSAYVNNNTLNKSVIRSNIISIIDKHTNNGYLNLALVANDIKEQLGDNIEFVDILGINGDSTLQTMLPVNKDCRPQLRQILTVDDDGLIHSDRDLNIVWYVID